MDCSILLLLLINDVYDGRKNLTDVNEIKGMFVEFQQHLYNVKVA
jgi:hypothetical protein